MEVEETAMAEGVLAVVVDHVITVGVAVPAAVEQLQQGTHNLQTSIWAATRRTLSTTYTPKPTWAIIPIKQGRNICHSPQRPYHAVTATPVRI